MASFNPYFCSSQCILKTCFSLLPDVSGDREPRDSSALLCEVAVSLHIYSPPFRECLVFPPTGGTPKSGPCRVWSCCVVIVICFDFRAVDRKGSATGQLRWSAFSSQNQLERLFFGREIFAPRGETEETQPGHTKRRWEPKHMNVEGPLQCPQC